MEAVTLPDESVIREIEANFVAAKLESAKHADVSRRMGVRWLPGLVVCDAEERLAHLVVGFLPPADLIPEITFGRAIADMGAKRYDAAHQAFAAVADAPDAERAPEALYWWGISRNRQMKNLDAAVREPWGRIVERWPKSQWARKVGYALGLPPKGA
jgi:TolA-binding protein